MTAGEEGSLPCLPALQKGGGRRKGRDTTLAQTFQVT